MAVQILPQEGSLGQTLGSSLGQGVSTGLQALANQKINRMQGLSSLNNLVDQAKFVGVSPDYLDLISRTARTNPELAQKQLSSAVKYGEKGVSSPGLWQKLFGGEKAVSPYLSNTNSIRRGIENRIGSPQESRSLQDILANPNISNEDKELLREEVLEGAGGKSLGELIGSVPVNILSGIVQGIGSLGGISGLLNSLASAPSFEEKLLKRELGGMTPGTPEYELVSKNINRLQERKKNAKLLPEASDIKENVVRPVASALGIEDLITNPDYLGSVSERVGNVAPLLGLSAIASGGPIASRLLSSAVTGIGSEAAGELAKRIVGPTADSAITLAGYLTGGFRPGKIKNIIKSGYKGFENIVSSQPDALLNAEPLDHILNNVEKNIAVSDKGSKFIKNRVADISRKIRTLTTKNAESLNIPRSSISAKEAFLLDKELGGDTFDAARKIGKKTTSRLTELRNGLRDIYQPYYGKLDSSATENLIAARNLERSMHARDTVQEFLEGITKGKTGFFNRALFALRKGGGGVAEARKYTKLFTEVPEFRRAFFHILQEGAKQNVGGTIKEINKLNKLAREKKIK